MNIQVLVATMDQKDHNLLEKMNIQTDAIIGNQCDRNEIEEFSYNGHNIKYLSFNERGVGLNRNNAIMRATADICILADDDLVYIDGYQEIVEKYFKDNPHADVLIFNLNEENTNRYVINRRFKVGYRNFMRFGAARLAFRTESIMKNGISFNLRFGGGTKYSAGEDTLFLKECLRKKLNIIAIPEFIAKLTEERESTWFNGYNDKYFRDRGALFAAISNKYAIILSLQFAIRHRNMFKKDINWYEAFKLMCKGINEIT